MKRAIFIAGTLHEEGLKALSAITETDIIHRPKISHQELKSQLANVEVLITRSGTTVDRELLDAAPKLKVVARAGVGIGNIDLSYATEKGVLVINAPGQNTTSAAELSFALLIAMMRRLPEAYQTLKNGDWDRHRFVGSELRGKTIGLVGLGNVGRRMARMCQGFSMNVFAYDPYLPSVIFKEHSVTRASSLEKLLPKINILSLHVPLNSETRGMITTEQLKLLPKGSWLVNTARGGVVCEAALLEALNGDHLSGCAIDTWNNEPAPHRALTSHPRVWGTPHIGAITEEAQIAVGRTIAQQVHKALAGEVVDYPVNIPGLHASLSTSLGSHMVLVEKLTSLALGVSSFSPQQISIHIPDQISDDSNQELLYLAAKKSYMSRVSQNFVSYANASTLFSSHGLTLLTSGPASTTNSSAPGSYIEPQNHISITLHGDKHHQLTVGGVVYDERHPRITVLDQFKFEVLPEGDFLVFRNTDQPGVVGAVGQFLAERGINIHSLYLSANQKADQAMAMVKIDHPLNKEVLAAFQNLPLILEAFAVAL